MASEKQRFNRDGHHGRCQAADWDANVQALAAFPEVLARMSQDVRWTTDLGNAFLAQQADVMYAVQRMRASAQARAGCRLTARDSDYSDRQRTIGDPDPTRKPAGDLCAAIRSDVCLGTAGVRILSGSYYPSFGSGYWPGINVGLFFGGWGGWGWGPNWFGGGLFINPDSSGATVSAVDMEALVSPLGRTTQLTGLA
jgi:hypothetical protein